MKRPHQISKLIFEIDVPAIEGAFSYQTDASSFVKNEVSSVLESLLDEFDQPGKIIRIDRLELNLESIDFSPANMPFLREELRKQLSEQLSEQLNKPKTDSPEAPTEVNVNIRSESSDVVDLIAYYLDHGRLPWWASHIKDFVLNDEVEKLLDENNEQFISLIQRNLSRRIFRLRLVHQLKQPLIGQILLEVSDLSKWKEVFKPLLFGEVKKKELTVWFERLSKVPSESAVDRLAALLNLAHSSSSFQLVAFVSNQMKETKTAEKLVRAVVKMESLSLEEKRKLLNKILGLHPIVKTEEKIEELLESIEGIEKMNDEPSLEDVFGPQNTEDENYAIVENAGLVIVQPYLVPFFTELNYLENKQFKSQELQHRAVYLLHYLATKEEGSPEEHHLTFNKLLCGINPDDPIMEFPGLSQEEKDESENLLTSLIGHWEALKSTSPDGMRQMFLVREGHLRHENDAWSLYIKREGQDVLLDKLPWGISLLMAPWMDKMVYVEW